MKNCCVYFFVIRGRDKVLFDTGGREKVILGLRDVKK